MIEVFSKKLSFFFIYCWDNFKQNLERLQEQIEDKNEQIHTLKASNLLTVIQSQSFKASNSKQVI